MIVPLAIPGAVVADDTPRERGSGVVADALLVQLRQQMPDLDVAGMISQAGGVEIGRFDEARLRVVSAPASKRAATKAALIADPRVQGVEDDAEISTAVTPSDPMWSRQWGPRKVRAPEAWDKSRGSGSTVIAIVDTGVDPNHPDLRGRVLRGYDFHNNDANPYDDDGHGTAVATTAAAAGNDGRGVAGMCWRCLVLPVKVLNGNGHGTHSNIAAGIVYATNRGADVINLSIAGLGSTTALGAAINYATRRGVVVVAAAGNAGTSRKTYPAAYDSVVAVAATDGLDRLYTWSNRGSWVTMSAPGCAYSGKPGGGYWSLCGTSMATPMVAGTAALMKSAAPGMARARLVSLLTGTAQRLRSPVGRGRLDAARAMRAVAGGGSGNSEPEPAPDPTPATVTRAWSGTLDADDQWDRNDFELRGDTHVRVRWSGDSGLEMWLSNSSGRTVLHRKGGATLIAEDRLPAGRYTMTLALTQRARVAYDIRIETEK
jgi:subtilisin family serine protease